MSAGVGLRLGPWLSLSEQWAISRSGRRRLHTESDFGVFFFCFDLVVVVVVDLGLDFLPPPPPSLASSVLSWWK